MNRAIEKIGDSYLVVNADGSPVLHRDAKSFVFHVSPQVYLDPERIGAWVNPDDVLLSKAKIVYGVNEINILPKDICIRQPYPNGCYYVAGTAGKIGWEINLPEGTSKFKLLLCWKINEDVLEKCLSITHKLNIDLIKSQQGHVYSMDQTHLAIDPNSRAIALLHEEEISEFFHKGNPKTYLFTSQKLDQLQVKITQDLQLTSCAYSDLMTEELESMQLLRDQKQVLYFKNFVQEHRDNASCEMPASVLTEAIELATKHEFSIGEEPVSTGSYLSHPALKLLSDWWNENTPVENSKNAIYCLLWIRVNDNEEYWSTDLEHPNVDIVDLAGSNACARCGDLFIMPYVFSVKEMAFEWEDFATLEALRDFPANFPVAWRHLKRMAQEEEIALFFA
jgi:hypothetical protein